MTHRTLDITLIVTGLLNFVQLVNGARFAAILWPIAWALAVFSVVVFTLDMLAGLLFPNWWVMQKAWEFFLPGFTFISWGTFFLGLWRVSSAAS